MTENELTKAVADAAKALRDLERERDEKAQAAADAVRAEYGERVATARRLRAEAEQALRNHIDATAAHPWDGKRVFKVEPKYASSWSRHVVGETRIDGIVEVVRQTSKFPDKLGHYGRPKLGSVIVRKVKKDGSPSLQFHRTWGKIMDKWTLATGEPT